MSAIVFSFGNTTKSLETFFSFGNPAFDVLNILILNLSALLR